MAAAIVLATGCGRDPEPATGPPPAAPPAPETAVPAPVAPLVSDAPTLAAFLRALAVHHAGHPRCRADLGLDADDEACALWALHRFLTTDDVTDGAVGGAFGIPYFWLTGTDARSRIVHVPDGRSLSAREAGEERTPVRYLDDLASDPPAYTHPDHPGIGAFPTFGWCSEREMAACALVEAWGLPARVVVAEGFSLGNHVRSEVLLTGEPAREVVLDHTFDRIALRPLDAAPDPAAWRRDLHLDRIAEEHASNRRYTRHYDRACHAAVREVAALPITAAARERLAAQAAGYMGALAGPPTAPPAP